MHRICIALILTWAVFGLGVTAVRGEDGDEKADAVVVRRVDLARYRIAAAPVGPRISTPPDLIETLEDPTDVSIWNVDWAVESGTWLPFEEPHLEGRVFSADTAIELLRMAVPPGPGPAQEIDIEFADETLTLRGPESSVARSLATVPWVLAGVAPSMRVDAILTSRDANTSERVRSVGGALLWPNRWTRIYRQVNEVPCAVHWDIEVAQEATTMDPQPMQVAEGEELYVRYHPGQTRSVVEVWAGSVDHLEIIEQDLSAVRNIPEANGPGVLSFPLSSVNRAFSAFVLPVGRAAERELLWLNEGRMQRLRLSFSGASAAQEPLAGGESRALVTLRIGAVADALEYDARRQTTEKWVEHLSSVLYESGLAHEERGEAFDYDVSTLGGPSVVLVSAPASELSKAQAALVRAEQELVERTVSLRTLAVPESSLREALMDGSLRVGLPLSPEVGALLQQAGAGNGEGVRMPLVMDTRVGFRVGRSVPGMTDFNTEIAQASAGLHPTTSARFAGLSGEMRLRRSTEGHALWVRGAMAWASRSAGSVGLLFRPPVSMKGAAEGTKVTTEKPRKVSMPLLGGGSAPVETEIVFAAGSTAEHLLQVHVRDNVVVLLLGRML